MDLGNENARYLPPIPGAVHQGMTNEQASSLPVDTQCLGIQALDPPPIDVDIPSVELQNRSASQTEATNNLSADDLGFVRGSYTSGLRTPFSIDAFDSYFDHQMPSWYLQEDFDLGMLSTPTAATMADLAPYWTQKPPEINTVAQTSAPNLKHTWFTHISDLHNGEHASGTATPLVGPRSDVVDEEYRRTLLKRLRHRTPDRPLPSADFLNLCVRMFFVHVHPRFPVVHEPSFRPSVQNSMLLLSICSVGSLFTGSNNAAEQGIEIFEQLNKAVLATWDRLICRDVSEVVPMIQAALIGQTFGLLSGHPKHLAIVDSFHGTVVSWARRMGVFEVCQRVAALDGLASEDVDQAWKAWARNEELLRLRLALHVHDAELTGIFHHEPLLRHSLSRIPQCSSDDLFCAPTAEDWASTYRRNLQSTENIGTNTGQQGGKLHLGAFDVLPASAGFTVYAALEGIAADVAEQRVMKALDDAKIKQIHSILVTFYKHYLKRISPKDPDQFGVVVLWHLTFMSIYVDCDLLERAVGRDGPPSEATDVASITLWAASTNAKRCVVHASLIHKNLEKMRIGVEPAIHVPRAMFLAALSWFCFIRYGPQAPAADYSTRETLDFPEIRLLGVNPAALLFESNGFRREKPRNVHASGALCGLIDLLQRIGHWEIARRFASILGALVHQETL